MEMPTHHPFKSAESMEEYLSHYDRRAKAWPVDSRPVLVDTSHGQTFVRISGPADGQPLVLMPGAAVHSLMWIPNIATLSQSYKTYAIDNIYDNGRSIYTRTFETADDFTGWLDELFTALALGDHINLMGLSYGGWLTSQYALRFPGRLRKIVLLAPASTVLPLRSEFMTRMSSGPIASLMYWMFKDLTHKDETGHRITEDMIEDMEIARRCFTSRHGGVYPTVLTDSELQNIKVPALYLVGENEKIYSAKKAVKRLNKAAPHIQTVIIPGAGHDLTFVQPEAVNARVLEFLQKN